MLDQVGKLHHGFLLYLRTTHHPLGQPGIFGQANDIGVFVGQNANPDDANDRAEVVATCTAHGDRPDDHQLIEVLGVGEFSDRGAFDVTAFEHLSEVHLGDPTRGLPSVVVIVGVNHQAGEHALHLALDFVKQAVKFSGLYEIGDIVIGMEALARGQNTLADFYGNWCSLINIGLGHCVFGRHQHALMLTAFACPGPVGRMAPAAR